MIKLTTLLTEIVSEMGLGDWGVENIKNAYSNPEKAREISMKYTGKPDSAIEKVLAKIAELDKEDFDQDLKDLGLYDLNEDCWDGYRQLGVKKKGNRTVPNCVKIKEDKKPKIKKAYLTKDAAAMKKEINRVKKLKDDDPSAYGKWDADYADKGKTKKYKTKKSVATTAYEKKFGKKDGK
jgi:hypothetical protein